MAAIFKVMDDEKSLEVYPTNEDHLMTFFVGDDSDLYSWRSCSLDKEEVEQLIEYLQRELKSME